MANTVRDEVFIYTTRELSTHLDYFSAFRSQFKLPCMVVKLHWVTV